MSVDYEYVENHCRIRALSKYFSHKLRFIGVFQETTYVKKDGAYVINLDDKHSTERHYVSLFIDKNTAVYFNSFGVEYIL